MECRNMTQSLVEAHVPPINMCNKTILTLKMTLVIIMSEINIIYLI